MANYRKTSDESWFVNLKHENNVLHAEIVDLYNALPSYDIFVFATHTRRRNVC